MAAKTGLRIKIMTTKTSSKTLSNPASDDDALRLDVWLCRARFFKTRRLAGQNVERGKIRLTRNGQTERITKPAYKVRAGDQIMFMRGDTILHFEVLSSPARRGPAPEAQTHYRIIAA